MGGDRSFKQRWKHKIFSGSREQVFLPYLFKQSFQFSYITHRVDKNNRVTFCPQNFPKSISLFRHLSRFLFVQRKVAFLLLGCLWANPVEVFVLFVCFLFFSFLFSVSVKVLPVTPLVSGVFVHRAFCAYFLRIERVVELRRFLWWTQ